MIFWKMNKARVLILSLLLALTVLAFAGCGLSAEESGSDAVIERLGSSESSAGPAAGQIDEKGTYDSRDQVALYIHVYEHLPDNYITKKDARQLGWQGGSVEDFAKGKCIGGDRFGNYEGILPEDDSYRECDIDTLGRKSRGSRRLIYSDDGDIYYTGDHYASFRQLYDAEGKVDD